MMVNEAIILIGSNINPQQNIRDCLVLLIDSISLVARSRILRTKSYESEGADFLNLSIKTNTILNEKQLKISVRHPSSDRNLKEIAEEL